MKKMLYLPVLFLLLTVSGTIFAQNQDKAYIKNWDLEQIEKTRVINPIILPTNPELAELFDNGPLVTAPGGGPGGADGSVLQTALGLTTYGGGFQLTAGNSIADDFTITGATWNVDSIRVYGYQTGSTTATSTFTGLYVRIYNGDPSAGGTLVWGDFTTNLFVRSYWMNAYRYLDTDPTNTTRPVMAVTASTTGLSLTAGTYWVEFTATGSLTSGPWMPPVSITGQMITGNAKQLLTTGWTAWVDGTSGQGAPFKLFGTSSAPIGPGPATNPTPASGAMSLPITGNVASWTNPAGATSLKLYFSADMAAVQNMDPAALAYQGAVISSNPLPALAYYTNYYWRLVETDGTGSTNGPVWTFKTLRDPATFFEDFSAGAGAWTITNEAPAACAWTVFNTPWPNTYLGNLSGAVLAADVDNCGTGSTVNSTATLNTGLNFSGWTKVYVEFDSDFRGLSANLDMGYVDISVDNGTNWTNVKTYQNLASTRITEHALVEITSVASLQPNVKIRFKSVQPGWDWWWVIDNVTIYGSDPIPVELVSFLADASNGDVVLNWATATETNNSHFVVERSADNKSFVSIGQVQGNGTTTEQSKYQFVDSRVMGDKVYYRLKQVDFNGTSEYSNSIEVNVELPNEYSLSQNHPNPFNPVTVVKFALPVDAKVTISLFNSLGQQVAEVMSSDLTGGQHEVSINGSNLSSGIYFYRIDASGVDGTKFSSVKKMILMK